MSEENEYCEKVKRYTTGIIEMYATATDGTERRKKTEELYKEIFSESANKLS